MTVTFVGDGGEVAVANYQFLIASKLEVNTSLRQLGLINFVPAAST